MGELGDLLELVGGAVDRIVFLSARVRDWRDLDVEQAAQQRARAVGGLVMGHMAIRRDGRPAGGTLERFERLVIADGGERWRVEHESFSFGPQVAGSQMNCCDGRSMWHQVSPGEVVVQPAGRAWSSASELLDPSWMAGYRLQRLAASQHEGRVIWVVRGEQRASLVTRVHAQRPHMFEADVDAELGILHRLSELLDDRAYHTIELSELNLDAPQDPDPFTYQPAPGVEVLDQDAWAKRNKVGPLMRLGRAIRWRISSRRRVHVTGIEPCAGRKPTD